MVRLDMALNELCDQRSGDGVSAHKGPGLDDVAESGH